MKKAMFTALFALSLSVAVAPSALAEETMTMDAQPVQETQSMMDEAAPAVEMSETVESAAPDAVMTEAPAAPLTAADFIMVSNSPASTSKQYAKKYQAVEFQLKNLKPNHLELLHAEVLNGVDEMAAAQEALEDSNRKRRGTGMMLRGLSAAPVLGVLGGRASYGAYRAASVASNMAANAAHTVEQSAQGGVADYDGRFVRKVDNVVISPEETFKFSTLLPKGESPQFKLVFKNLETNAIYDLKK